MSHSVEIPAVVPAAGLGTRMRTLCGDRPKELLPVGGLAAIEYSLLEAREAGIRRVAVVVRPDKPLIESFLAGQRPATLGPWRYRGSPRNYKQYFEELLFVVQPEVAGVADAIARARSALGADAVACLMPDNLALTSQLPIAACLESYHATGLSSVAAVKVRPAEASRFADCGGVEVSRRGDGRLAVRTIQDKGPGHFKVGPAGEALRAIGRSVLVPSFFDLFEEREKEATGEEVDDVPIYQALAAAGELIAAPVEGECFDLGIPEGYEAALSFEADLPAGDPEPLKT